MKIRTIKMIKLGIAISLLVLGALSAALYTKNKASYNVTLREKFHGTLLTQPRDIPSFLLTDTNGVPFSQNNLKDRWTMMFFGFTRCGFLCPTTMKELGKMYRRLEGHHVSSMPHVVMISIDPERDSLDQLKNYVKAFHPSFDGAAGSEEMTHALTKSLGVAYAKIKADPHSPAKTDDIEHTGAIMLFNPSGQLAAFFTTPHLAEDMADDFELLLKAN